MRKSLLFFSFLGKTVRIEPATSLLINVTSSRRRHCEEVDWKCCTTNATLELFPSKLVFPPQGWAKIAVVYYSPPRRGPSEPSPGGLFPRSPLPEVGHRRAFFRRHVVVVLLCGWDVAAPWGRRRPSGARESQLFGGVVITKIFSKVRKNATTMTLAYYMPGSKDNKDMLVSYYCCNYKLLHIPGSTGRSVHSIDLCTLLLLFFSHTSTFQLLDKPWSQVSSLLPPGSCLQILSRSGFVQQSHCSSIVHRVLLPHALALPASQFVHNKQKFPRI